jgi:xylulokinase
VNFLVIDLGTQSIKVALADQNGEILALSQQSQEVFTPNPGWAQQKPELWWNLTKKAISDIIEQTTQAKDIKGICTCGQMHGPVGIGENGEITTEWTQIWMDKRCVDICRRIREQNDVSKLTLVTGNPITPGWVGFKVRWIKEHYPQEYGKTRWFLVPKDFINYQLTHVAATDYSEASGTFLFDAGKEQYSPIMANILDIDLNKFAPIFNSYDIIGTLQEDLTKEFGFSRTTPVFAGGGDFIVSLLGLGMTKELAIDMTGTSTLFVVNKDKPIINPTVQNLRHVMGGWLPFTMLDCGGLAMSWCKEFLSSTGSGEISYEHMIELAENVPEGCNGLLFYPYLLGERRPDNIFAKGCFFGLALHHQAGHIARSVMEGVALALAKNLETFQDLGVNVKQIRCVGGATRNRLLYQIKANIMQIPQLILEEPEASLRGCALLAAYGSGVIKDLSKVISVKPENTINIDPNPEVKHLYDDLREEFTKMYNQLLGYWSR